MAIDLQKITTSLPTGEPVTDPLWRPAQSYAIQRDGARQVWHAGHVSALLSDGTYVLAGTHTGGVWLLNPALQTSYSDGHRATALSNNWTKPDIMSLAYGLDGRTQVFVGCANTDRLYFLQLKPLVGEMSLDKTTEIPLPFQGSVFGIAVVSDPLVAIRPRVRLVLATSAGVWWADVPQFPDNSAGYAWQAAEGLPSNGCYSGVAPAGWTSGVITSQNVAVAAYGGASLASGIYLGAWVGSKLVFSPAAIEGVSAANMRRTSLASCVDYPNRLYAISAAADDTVLTVLGSDGGAKWQPLGVPPTSTYTGDQGDWNQCIAVSPRNPDIVAFGWRAGGPFFWDKAAQSWKHPTTDVGKGDGAKPDDNLHGDLHALYFARTSSAHDTLYVGCDGGITYTTDQGETYNSQFNRPLLNLQIYGITTNLQTGATYGANTGPGGTLTASSRFPGLLACGTQDNGNLCLFPRQESGMAWRPLEGGDGGLCLFIDPLGALLQIANDDPLATLAFWNDSNQTFTAPEVVPVERTGTGITPTGLTSLSEPALTSVGLMFACAGDGSGNVYGLVSLPVVIPEPVPHTKWVSTFRKIVNLGSEVVGLASLDGQTILAGTVDGRVVRITTASGSASNETLPSTFSQNVMVSRIELLEPPFDFRALSSSKNRVFALRGNTILHYDGASWQSLPGWDWLTFAVEPDSERLFAANEASVFEFSWDRGVWTPAATGLPVFAHCTDLRIADNADGGRDLFLATYGRSVWRTTITLRPSRRGQPDLPLLVAETLFGVLQDGGGVVRVGKHLLKIPPGPLAQDLLVGLAVYDFAQHMSAESRRSIQRTVLKEISAVALRELNNFL